MTSISPGQQWPPVSEDNRLWGQGRGRYQHACEDHGVPRQREAHRNCEYISVLFCEVQGDLYIMLKKILMAGDCHCSNLFLCLLSGSKVWKCYDSISYDCPSRKSLLENILEHYQYRKYWWDTNVSKYWCVIK